MLELEFGKAGHHLMRAWLDLAIVKLLCAAVLPPIIVDYQEWKDIFAIANSTYKPAGSSAVVNNHIPTEAAQATEALEAVWKRLGVFWGLEGIGKTRFATICVAAISLQCCLLALHELLDAGIVKFGPKKVSLTGLFKSGRIHGMNFEIDLNQFIQVEGSIEKAIVCLGSSQTNPADVYKYWIAICGCIKQVLNNNENGFTTDNIRQIYGIINTHFHEQLRDGPADCYLTAFSLEPYYVWSAILCSHPNHDPLALTIKIPAQVPSKASLSKIPPTQPDSKVDPLLQSPTFSHWQIVHKHPMLSFYDLNSLIKPPSEGALVTNDQTHRSYLNVEDDDGLEELDEDNIGAMCEGEVALELENEIDLSVAVATGVLLDSCIETGQQVVGDINEKVVSEEEDPDAAWEW
ncbi:hypothetical protein PAXRUDRAFT_25790 [Paxillus rubicundulus Ve08.2h10]|uniref:Uncharacterized protein n=1 Tax=Paxillus rubicundulus Ve08.2h10 TaxID=930991 RepID=A0A0D0DQK4_9AGAM|nr:hypothetical protein PAXRUDRAFT_25790 [Paxillus rubicundulus Ve08.2h10]